MFADGQLMHMIEMDFELNWSGKVSFGELDLMLPWQRDIYIALHINKLKEERDNG